MLATLTHKLKEEPLRWARPLIVLGVILGSLVLPDILPQRVAMLLIALPFVVIVAWLFASWTGIGMVSVVVASMAVPIEIGTGTGSSLNAGMLTVGGLLGLWILDIAVKRWRGPFVHYSTLLPLLAMVTVTVLSFGVGQLYWFVFASGAPIAAQAGGVMIFALSAGVFIWVGHRVRDIKWIKLAVFAFLLLSAIYIVSQIYRPLYAYVRRLIQSGATDSLFWTWLVALAFSQLFFNPHLRIYMRVALAALLLAAFYVALYLSRGWVSGWVPPMVAVGVILWLGSPRLGLLATLVGAGGVAVKVQQLMSELLFVGDNEYSLMTRLEAWRIMGEIIKINPILGLGPANYHYYTSLYPILGYYVRFNSHNNYVDILAQIGFLGLLSFFVFAFAVGRLGWQLHARVPEGFARAYVYGALGGLAGMLVAGMLGDWVLPFVYNVGFKGFRSSVLGWLFLGGLVVLDQIYAKETADAA